MYLDSTDHGGGGEGRIKTGTSWRALVCVGGSDEFFLFFFFFFGVLSGFGGELMDHRRRQEMKGQASVLALDKGKNKNERTISSSSNNIN
jgi:hypothetical protein